MTGHVNSSCIYLPVYTPAVYTYPTHVTEYGETVDNSKSSGVV